MENRIGAQDSYSVMAANPVFLMGGYAALGFEARFMYDSFRLLASLSSFFDLQTNQKALIPTDP